MKRLKKSIGCILMSLIMTVNMVSPVFATGKLLTTGSDGTNFESNIGTDGAETEGVETEGVETEGAETDEPEADEPEIDEPEVDEQPIYPDYLDIGNSRVLYRDDFSSNNGDAWNVTSPTVCTFSDGKAHIKGSGPENRIALKDKIMADSFTISLDLWVNSGNTNSHIKFGIKAQEGYGTRYQVRFNTVQNELYIDKPDGTVIKSDSFKLPPKDEPYQIVIDVNGDTISVSVDGSEKLSANDTGIKDLEQGYFVIACQYPAQDISVDNLIISTPELPVGDKYQLTLKTTTDGAPDIVGSEIGGTISADVMDGYHGDSVTLLTEAKPGFIFDKYTSSITDTGNSTDGLLDIINNRFRFDSKTGSITITAHFITEPVDPNTIFKDRFDGELNSHGKYKIPYEGNNTIIEGGKLKISALDSTPNYITVDGSDWVNESLGHGYTIEFDAAKANSTAGTFQMAFRINDFSERYVLVLNGDSALLRRFEKGVNNELAKVSYTFNQTTRRISIDVQGDTVAIYSDGKNIMTYKNNDTDKDKASWADIKPGLGIINMTNGAPVFVDNILVTKKLPVAPINIKITQNGDDDPAMIAGTVVAKPAQASEGETVTLISTAKPGYKLEGYTSAGIQFDGQSFVMPTDVGRDGVTIVANFVTEEFRTSKTFYIDSVNGDDDNHGESEARAWKSLEKIHPDSPTSVVLVPGDNIKFKSGSVFSGKDAELRFTGSGVAGKPISFGVYGDGARPRFDGEGAIENVISTYNQEYITIDGLEITNLHPRYNNSFDLNTSNNRVDNLRAINIFAKDYGVVSGIHLQNLYIHDINGNIGAKWNGGIFFDIQGSVQGGKLQGIPTKYDDILIENCTIERVDRSAIKLVSSVWCNQSLSNNPAVPINWYPSTGVVVRGNVIRQAGGDGITVRDTENALIEYNIAANSRYQNTGYNAGIWPFEAVGTVIQYNEAYLTRGVQDGQGFDCDHLSSYSVMQYNYSHDNEGGFMLLMNGFPHTAPTVRYNISQNDKDKTFEFSRGSANGTMIYNNTIYSNAVLTGRKGVFDMANSVAGTGNRPFYVFNNIFWYPENQAFYCGEANNLKDNIQLFNNAYMGGIVPPAEEEQAIIASETLVSPGTGPSLNNGSVPTTGKYLTNELDGYKLLEGSELIDAGFTVDDILPKYGGQQTDYRHLSPVELHELAKNGKSIDFAAGSNFPDISGVDYSLDFFGNPMISGDKPDIGAMEFQSGATDITLPQVQSVTPIGNDIKTSSQTLSVTFDKPMDTSVVGIVSLSSPDGSLQLSNLSWTNNGQTVNYELPELEYDTAYSISVKDFTDLAGNTMTLFNKVDIFTTVSKPVINSTLTVSPKTASVKIGNKQQFTAQLYVNDIKSDQVTWTLDGATSSSIDDKGLLTVDIKEKAKILTVTATSMVDKDISDTAIVTVVATPQKPNDSDNDSSGNNGNNNSNDAAKEKATEIKVYTTPMDNGWISAVVSNADIKTLADTKNIAINVSVAEKDKNSDITISIPAEIVDIKAEKMTINVDGFSISLNTDILRGKSDSQNKPITMKLEYMDKEDSNIPDNELTKLINAPAFNVSLTVGTDPVSKFAVGDNPVIVFPYAPTANELQNSKSLVVYSIKDDGTLKIVPSSIYDDSQEGMVLRVPELGKYVIGTNEVTFTDVSESSWAKYYIDTLASRGIISGMSMGNFVPNAEVTRAQFISMLLRTFDIDAENPTTTYVDVAPGAWYYNSIATAEKYNMLNKTDSDTINPNESLTREEMAYILNQLISLYGFKSADGKNTQEFKDISETSDWAQLAVSNIQDYGIINGREEDVFMPKESLTRAEAAVVITKLLNLSK